MELCEEKICVAVIAIVKNLGAKKVVLYGKESVIVKVNGIIVNM